DNVLANPDSDADGNTTAYRFDNVRDDKVSSFEVGARGKFETGSISHRTIISASAFSMDSRNAYAFSDFAGFAGNLYEPTQVAPPATDFFFAGSFSDPLVTEETNTSSVAIADMMGFNDDTVLVTLGARWQ